MKKINYIIVLCLVVLTASTYAQGLEGIVVERYYSANAADVANATSNGATTPLTVGSTTFRVYVDMAAGYKFSQIYGSPTHSLTVSSTSNFYNDPNYGVSLDAGTITLPNISKKTAMIDSWFTTGGTAAGKVGVLKTADTDGSVGNINAVLANNPGSCFGLPITGSGSQDGIAPSSLTTYLAPNPLGLGSSLDPLDQTPGNSISINNGAIAALGGIVGPTAANMVLIGQFTTSGSLSFVLNVQLINVSTGLPENYVASSPVSGELTNATLTQTVTPTCPPVLTSDSPDGAVSVSYSSNMNYPNCYPINGTVVTSTDSPESVAFTGPDTWYKFVAQSSAASITLTSTTMDDAIALYSKSGSVYTLIDSENASSGAGDFERLNTSALTPGVTYYVSVGAVSGTSGSTFSLCIQNLMPSGCASIQPVGGFSLCEAYKAIARGSASSGVSYSFSFTGVGGGASGTTSLSGTNGLISLNNSALALRYGGIYNVQVDALYALQNSASAADNITVNGSVASANCSNVTIMNAPRVEVKLGQRCPAVLSRSTFLIATPVTGDPLTCGAVSYTFEFTQVTDCTGLTSTGLPFEVTTVGSAPYLPLAIPFPSALANTGFWKVRAHANFSYGAGTYGTAPYWTIQVNGSSASIMNADQNNFDASSEKSEIVEMNTGIYPNPSTGEMLHVNVTDIKTDRIQVRILDAIGKVIYNGQYSVDGSLNTTITFNQTLAQGIYTVEFIENDKKVVEKFVVQK